MDIGLYVNASWCEEVDLCTLKVPLYIVKLCVTALVLLGRIMEAFVNGHWKTLTNAELEKISQSTATTLVWSHCQ